MIGKDFFSGFVVAICTFIFLFALYALLHMLSGVNRKDLLFDNSFNRHTVSFSGIIYSIDSPYISVVNQAGDTDKFIMFSNSKIIKFGYVCRYMCLNIGDPVRVLYLKLNNNWIVDIIDNRFPNNMNSIYFNFPFGLLNKS